MTRIAINLGTFSPVAREQAVSLPSISEEGANQLTHGLGLLASIVAAASLIGRLSLEQDLWQALGCGIYAATLVALYAASTMYHSTSGTRWYELCRFVDYSCIYMLIAGTYTPISLTYLRDDGGWMLFGVIWAMAFGGIVLKMCCWGKLQTLSTVLYMAMGWTCLGAVGPMMRNVPGDCLFWILLGGLAYTAGVWFFVREKMAYSHAIWHLFVLAGSACHYWAISHYIAR